MGKMKEKDSELQDLREEFFDGPMSDSMSFDQFLLSRVKVTYSGYQAASQLN